MMKVFIVYLSLLSSSLSFAESFVKSVTFESEEKQGKINIFYEGQILDYPELTFNRNIVSVEIPNSKVGHIYSKQVGFKGERRDIELNATQASNKKVAVKAILPFDISENREKVSLTIKENKIELVIPKLETNPHFLTKARAFDKTMKTKKVVTDKTNSLQAQEVSKNILNENFLKKLETEQLSVKDAKNLNSKTIAQKVESESKDVQAKPVKDFSFLKYIGKFVAFLCLVLLFFYGAVAFMRKGFLKKGKLGFLNNTKQIEILGQTYVAPKKSLMMIKVHNQVFLLSNTDAGINLVSELKNPTDVIKAEERSIAGNNFDDSLSLADTVDDVSISLKKDINQSSTGSVLESFMRGEPARISDQIKQKVKGLRPLDYRG